MSYQITVNGKARTVEAPPDMPLLWVLRDLLGLTGTKYGCGVAQCRACTVHLAGVATFACQVPISAVGAQPVTTIEGLAAGQVASKSGERGGVVKLHVLQEAWIAEDVPQCGYCQPGQLMSAAALLASNPSPNDAEIDQAMVANLCRCGTYPRIRKAIHRAAAAGAAGLGGDKGKTAAATPSSGNGGGGQ